ncbi:MAG: hypothetical protein LBS50_10695 [Prevotellaceae bacterium]|jgi:hypothetical protein|nr:hypothetical protein [Prevotellaceae bacterium]
MTGILIDETGDLKIEVKRNSAGKIIQGMVIGDCDADIAERVIKAWAGEFKEKPILGGNIVKYQNGKLSPFWCDDVQRQLKGLGLKAKITFENGDIIVEI